MCVQTNHSPWERPAAPEDLPIFGRRFPGIDFRAAFEAMSVDGCVPLTADLAIVGATLSTPEDDLGVRFLPFTAVDVDRKTCVKIPEMDDIVPWMENSALGTYMWREASAWMEREHGCRIEFAMNCGCGSVRTASYANGDWRHWVRRFNEVRKDLYGLTEVARRDSIAGTTMTEAQRTMWKRIRATLAELPDIRQETGLGRVAARGS
jgi:hypothetical protein